MENEQFNEHPLDSMLDLESQEEFGEPLIKSRFDHGADADANGNLRDWTAQDFSSIYVRFRPHLERHARRYLSNPVAAEEVVQDAFLYLMTNLPELDSELGVLKFLKWKIRLLCFDVLRSASNRRETYVPEHAEFASEESEITADLERAEDNAIIRLALARLSPRQREVLIASVYEEKSSEEISKQMGMSPNAARQLLFRARSAFKKALVGEAEIHGKSISQVLTIAARKAALDAKENAIKVGAFIVLVAVGIGTLPALVPANEAVIAESVAIETPATTQQIAPAPIEEGEASVPAQGSAPEEPAEPQERVLVEIESEQLSEETEEFNETPRRDIQELAAPVEQKLSNQSMGTILATNVSNAGIYTESYADSLAGLFQGVGVEVFGGTGISAFLDLNVESKSVSQIIFQMWVDGERYFGAARSTAVETLDNGDGYTVAVVSEEFYVVDEDRNVFSESPLADSRAVVTLELSQNGEPLSASLKISNLK